MERNLKYRFVHLSGYWSSGNIEFRGFMHRLQIKFRKIKALFPAVVAVALSLASAAGQTQDTSGNGLLKGSFRFRHVAVQLVDANFNPTDITAVYGTITFDGAGNYTIAGTSVDNSVSNGAPQPLNMTGTYAIGSNGAGYLTNELYPNDPYDYINGAVAQGVFTGSTTESQGETNTLNDIFIAIPVGAPPTNASFITPFQTGLIDFQNANSSSIMNALFELTPNGQGGFGTISLNGQASNQTDNSGDYLSLTQTVTGATYNFNSDGSATLTVPLPTGVSSTNALLTGSRTIFESADGNFILGWTASGFDIFFGVKALAITGTNTVSAGLYFTTALEDEPAPGAFGTDSYYGGTSNTGDGAGDGVVHERLNVPSGLSYDFGTDDQIELNPDGTSVTPDFNGYQYIFGDAGNGLSEAFVAIGTEGLFSLQVGFHAPAFSGPGVYLNPIGVNNAASFQPVTASIAPGEDIALYGTGLSSVTTSIQGGQVFPTTLGGVSVTIDGIPCPLYSVSPGQINAVVPYELASNPTGLANIQVTNNNVPSNVVQVYATDAAPGAFSQTQNGIGFAAALHGATNQLITNANPAEPGEYISLYLTGLGTVNPPIADGAVGPSNPLSYSDLYDTGFLTVNFIDYTLGSTFNPGNIQYAGLVPTLAGLYQVNVQVPTSGLGAGDVVYVEFITDAADVNQIQIPLGFGSSARPAARRRAKPSRIKTKGTPDLSRVPRP
jgi:uncharacterized protein (TIGR03437 family)